MTYRRITPALVAFLCALSGYAAAQPKLPSDPLVIRDFTLQFDPAGTFSLSGAGWPSMAGSWTLNGNEVTLALQNPPKDCGNPGVYTFSVDSPRVSFALVKDDCQPRRMILDRSEWLPRGVTVNVGPRAITRVAGSARGPLPPVAKGAGHWPSFRGAEAAGAADGQHLPDRWNAATGEGVLWRTAIPGLAHSSPIVWGDLVFVTSAISSRKDATFKPGLYGDGDASDDRSRHRWMLYAVDKRTGKIRWERAAAEGEPLNKRHIKSTYASASPATDGRIVVAWFGSQGVYAYDLAGGLRWKVDLGRVDMGAYDIPSLRMGAGQLADHLERAGDRPVRYAGRFVSARARRRDRRNGVEDGSPGAAVVGHADRRDDERGAGAGDQRVELHSRLRPEDRDASCGGSAAARRSRRRARSSPRACT